MWSEVAHAEDRVHSIRLWNPDFKFLNKKQNPKAGPDLDFVDFFFFFGGGGGGNSRDQWSMMRQLWVRNPERRTKALKNAFDREIEIQLSVSSKQKPKKKAVVVHVL